MDAHLASVLWFALGVAVQAAFVIRTGWNWGLLFLCLFLAAAGMFPVRSEASYELFGHVLTSIGLFGVALAIVFEKAILPVINEKIVLSYTMVLWYICSNFFKLGLPAWLIFALLVPRTATLVIAFAQPPLNLFLKAALYAWFLVLVLSLGLMQFSFGRLLLFMSPKDAPWLSPLECVTTGMAFLYLCVNATFVFQLIPIKGRDQTWEDEMKEWHALTNLMAYRFMDGPSPAAVVVAIDAFSTRYKISSNRTNDRSWMTGLGYLAMDGVVSPERPSLRRIVCKRADGETHMPMRYGEKVLANRGAMARATKSQGRV